MVMYDQTGEIFMKTYWAGLFVLILAVSLHAAENIQVKVTGDRVSLRAAPELNSVLIDRAMSGDLLTLKDNSQKDWVGVAPPSDIDVWVHSEFVLDGEVLPARLNLRSGPSLNHSVVGVVDGGKKLTIRGNVGEWLRVAPPEETVVWISRRYSKVLGEVAGPATMIKVEAADEPVAAETTENDAVVIVEVTKKPDSSATPVLKTVTQPEVNEVMVTAAQSLELPDVLVPDSTKEQGVTEILSGTLQLAGGVLYKLVRADGTTVCYVRGNVAQLKKFNGKPLAITGKTYRAVGLDQPLIVPVKIQVLSRS
jgi:hypothetical protein